MAVNQNVYSNKNNWLNYNPRNVAPNILKIPSYTNILNGINNGFIPQNLQLDTSITTVQADKGFSGGIVNYVRGNTLSNFNENHIIRNILDEFECTNIGLFSVPSTNPQYKLYINVNNFGQYVIAPNFTASNNKTTVKPILSYGDNKNIKLVIAVLSTDNPDVNYASNNLYDLKTFLTKNHKYVLGVYAIPFILVNNEYRLYQYDYFSLTYQLLNYPTKTFNFYNNTTLNRNSRIYSFMPKNQSSVVLNASGGFSVQTSQVFPVFCQQYGDSGYDLRQIAGENTACYYPSVGFMPKFTISELNLNTTKTQNGVTVKKTNNGIIRYIDLTDTEYWGDDNTKFIEWCKKQTAYFGMFFTDSYDYRNSSIDSENTYLGVIDEFGITHGEYVQGSKNKEQTNYSNDIISDIEKIPPEKIQKDKGDLTSNINPFRYKSPNQLFILDETDLNDLFTFINIGYRPNEENFILDFKGKNPIDYIVSVNVFPFDIPTIAPTEVDLSIGGIPVKKSPFLETAETVKVKQLGLASEFVQPIFDFGTVSINPYFNDFRDYEPFTRCEIQLPYCGTYTVDLKKFMNKNLSVKYVVDYNTGACTALIFMDDLLIDTVDGQIGFSIPLSGIAQGEYQNTIQRNSYNAKIAGYDIVKSGINQISNVLTGNLKGATNSTVNSLSAIETGLQANYELSHTAPQPTILSTADTLNSFCQDNRARLLFYRCEVPRYDEEVFKKTVGYACIKSGKVSDFTGLMICSNVKLDNINCTDTEKNILKNLLTSGVYN